MTEKNGNLIAELIVIVQRCKALNNELLRAKRSKETLPVEATQETVNDIHTLLCKFMTSMISSPITGRLFMANPVAYVDEETRIASLRRQLQISE